MKTRRERVRAAAIDEIKSIAWDLAKKNGMAGVTVNGIARLMGMTPPAFYSYFKSREDLIQALVIDAYRSYSRALITARDSIDATDSIGRLYHVFMAYRAWAIENPNLFLLFVGNPAHGFENPTQEILDTADLSNQVFINLYEEIWQKGLIQHDGEHLDLPGPFASEIDRICKNQNLTMPRTIFNLIVRNAMLLHGMISFELSNRFAGLLGDQSAFYQFQVLDMFRISGIEYTP